MKTVIFGAGDHAREVADILKAAGQSVLGYVDGDPTLHGKHLDGLPVLGGDDWLAQQSREEICVLPAVGTPRVIRIMAEKVESLGFRLGSAVHPTAVVSEHAQLGPGAILFPYTVVNTGAKTGSCVCLNIGTSVSHDCEIGSFCNINPGVRLAGRVTIGSECYLGMSSQYIQGLTVGSKATIGAGAVVISDIPDSVLAVGVPARVKKHYS